MRNLALLAALAGATLAAPAFAQDKPFTGPRAGALLGYDKLEPGSTRDSSIRHDRSADGLVYGGDVGYDASFGHALVGVEGEVTGSTAHATNDPLDPADFGYGRIKAGRDLYLGARAGFLATPQTLVYAKGGYTNQRLDLTADNGDTTTGRHFTLDGYRVGAGVEESLTPRTYAKIEYRYSNYGDARLEYLNGTNTRNFDVDTDRHQVMAGVGFRL